MTAAPVGRALLEDFGGTWTMVRAPESAAEALAPPEHGGIGVGYVLDFYRLHVLPDQLDEFDEAVRAEPSLTFDDLAETMSGIAMAVYDGLPFMALLALWAHWPERRHVMHGKLVAMGHSGGVADLDLYDVACLVWADLEEQSTASPFTVGDTKQRAKLRDQLMAMEPRPGGSKTDVDAMKALLSGQNGSESEDGAEDSATIAD